jgi:glutathionylspermidine synthase
MKRQDNLSRISKSRLEEEGFIYHTVDGDYWNDKSFYVFTELQAQILKQASEELHLLCKEAVDYVVRSGDYQSYGLTPEAFELASKSWLNQEPHLYGRFDFAWDGTGAPKLLEYNADTPTALLEAGKVQQAWLNLTQPAGFKVFSEIPSLLTERFSQIIPAQKNLFLSCMKQTIEDEGNVLFMLERALLAGLEAQFVYIEDLSWNPEINYFCTSSGTPVDYLFKLYPWEWMVRDEFSSCLPHSQTRFLEPAWKQLLSNKALLAVLWKLFPGHPNLLPASFDPKDLSSSRVVTKPILGREGANVKITDGSDLICATNGAYKDVPVVYQEYYPIPNINGYYATLGLWMIGDQCAGLGVREDVSIVTKNTSLFVPHIVV